MRCMNALEYADLKRGGAGVKKLDESESEICVSRGTTRP